MSSMKKDLRIKSVQSCIAVILLILVTSLVAILTRWTVLLLFPGTVLLSLVGGILYALWMSKKISLEAEMFSEPSGGAIHLTVSVNNRSILPLVNGNLLLRVENLTFSSITEKQIELAAPGRKWKQAKVDEIDLEIQCNCCGKYRVSLEDLTIMDGWGIFMFHAKGTRQEEVSLYPKFVPVDGIEPVMRPNYDKEKLFSGRRSELLSDILQYREYQAGDSLKKVNWKLSAKSGDLIIREFDTPIDNETLLLYDISRGPVSEQSLVLQLLASISMEYINQGFSHMAGWYSKEKEDMVFQNIQERDDVFRMLETIFDGSAITDGISLQMANALEITNQYANVIEVSNVPVPEQELAIYPQINTVITNEYKEAITRSDRIKIA